jgi:hypothetical protein
MSGPFNTVLGAVPLLKEAFAMKTLRALEPHEMEKAQAVLKDVGYNPRQTEEFLGAYQRALSLE